MHVLDPGDRPVPKAIDRLAEVRRMPIHIHSGAAPVRLFFELEPGLMIIRAHAGKSEPAEIVGAMLDEYGTLHADTSYRAHDIPTADGTIAPDWFVVITRRSDRLMVGTDSWVNSQWDNYEELVDLNRRWLSKLPHEIAARIAYRNAARLFRRKISPVLPGLR